MLTEPRYYDTPAPTRALANLLSVETREGRSAAVLDSTIFYPEGGGQSSDRGRIGGLAIVDVRQEAGIVYHYLDADSAHALKPGQVELRLDEERRRDLACRHSAQHLLSAVILKELRFPTVSMHLGTDGNTIDVDASEIGSDELHAIEVSVYALVEADLPIRGHLCPPECLDAFPLRKIPPEGEETVRVIEIQGVDFSPCCGVHLASTGGIGTVKIIGAEKYKGLTRVSFIAGRRAFEDYRETRAVLERMAKLFGVRPDMVENRVRTVNERLTQQDRSLIMLRETVAGFEAERLAKSAGRVISENFPDRNYDEALRVGRALQRFYEGVIVVASSADLRAAAMTASKSIDLRPAMKALTEAQKLKGGGGPSLFQVAFDSRAALERFMAEAAAVFKEER